jgi:hypothetical protein
MFFTEILFEQQTPQQAPPKKDSLVAPKANKNEPSQDDQYSSQQNEDNTDYDEEDMEDEEGMGEQTPQEPQNFLPPDLAPIKRYYLIQRMKDLSNILDNFNIKNEDLELVLKFSNDLSYESLMLLGTGVIQTTEQQLARLTNG